jgi:multidrug resistance efflux pump
MVARYLMAAALVAGGVLSSVSTFETGNVRVLARLMDVGPDPAAVGGIVRPAVERTIAADVPVTIQEVLVEPGQTVSRGEALFIVEDRHARLALPGARFEMEDARLEVESLELALGALDAELQAASARLTTLSGQVDVAARRAATIATPQVRGSTARAQAALELATLKLTRAEQLYADKRAPWQEVEDAEVAVRVARDDLEQARRAERAFVAVADVESERAALRNQLAALEEQKGRSQRLADLGRARVRYQRAIAAVQSLEQRAATSRIEAPFSGTVSEVHVSRGDLVVTGAVLARVADLARLIVEVQVPSSVIPSLRAGARADIRLGRASAGVRTTGAIRSIDAAAGPNGRHRVVVGFEAPAGVVLTGQAATMTFASAS